MSESGFRVTPVRISKNSAPLVCPPDKSVTHRAFLFSLLSSGKSSVAGPLLGEDCLASLEAVRKLGAQVARNSAGVEITGFGIRNFAPTTTRDNPLRIDCQNSGTTIRLLSGILAGQRGYFNLFGDSSLSQRPMGRVADPLSSMGAAIYPRGIKKGAAKLVPTPPVDLEPAPGGLKAMAHELKIASAQVKSAILLAGLYATGGETAVTEPSLSRDHTERMLREMGIEVRVKLHADGRATAAVDGSQGQELAPLGMTVGGDPSSAAFWACAAVMQERPVRIQNVLLNPSRLGFAEVLRRMGARIVATFEKSTGGEQVGLLEIDGGSLKATEVRSFEVPTLVDEVPMLAIAAIWAEGTTCFRGVQELRVKESDRLEAIIEFIASIGGRAWAESDDLFVEGLGRAPAGPRLGDWFYSTLGDHRLAMAAVITADALSREIVLDDAECIKVSYPDFFTHREKLSK